MSRRLLNYKTIMVEEINDLGRQVKYFVSRGYELHGSPFQYHDIERSGKNYVVQAMVKYEAEPYFLKKI